MTDPTVQLFQLVNGSQQFVPLSSAVDTVSANPDGYTIRPAQAVSGPAFVSAALLNLYQDSINDPTATSADLLAAITSNSNDFETEADAAAASIPSDRSIIRVGARVYASAISNPSHTDGKVQSANGRWFEVQPDINDFEVVDLPYFLRRNSDPATALTEALKTLYANPTDGHMRLEGYGIELNLKAPLELTDSDLNLVGNETRYRRIDNLKISAISGVGHTWAYGDALFSLKGNVGTGAIFHNLLIDNLNVDCGGRPITGFRLTGYLHVNMNRPTCKGIINGGFGTSGIGFHMVKGIGGGNHGLTVTEMDITDLSGNLDTQSIGVLCEDGDAKFISGWVTRTGYGLISKSGAVTTNNIHFSMAADGSGLNRCAIWAQYPQDILSIDDEIDHGFVLIEDSPNNLMNPGNYVGSFQTCVIDNPMFGLIPNNNPTGYGLITFKTGYNKTMDGANLDANTKMCRVTPRWGSYLGGGAAMPYLAFVTTGAGVWDQSSAGAQRFQLSNPNGTNTVPTANFPAGVRIPIKETAEGGLFFHPGNGVGPGFEFFDNDISSARGGATNRKPFLHAYGNSLRVATNTGASALVERWEFNASGQFQPVTDKGANIGSATNRVGMIYRSSDAALTAHAGGGQASALALTSMLNRVTTVATAADSVVLPVATAGLRIDVENAGANAMQVFANGSDTINGTAGATGLSQAIATVAIYRCYVAGAWTRTVGAIG
jgi:hypothetical protein